MIDVANATIIPALNYSAPYPQYGISEAMSGDGSGAFWAALLESVGAIGGALFAACSSGWCCARAGWQLP